MKLSEIEVLKWVKTLSINDIEILMDKHCKGLPTSMFSILAEDIYKKLNK